MTKSTKIIRKRHVSLTEDSGISIKIFRYAMLVFTALFLLVPFYVMISTSLMNKYEGNSAIYKFWPEDPSFEWYTSVLTEEFGGYSAIASLITTSVIYIPSSIIGVLVSAMSAFAFAKMQFPLKNMMFAVLMATMMIPNNMSLIVSFSLFDMLGWIGSIMPLFVPRLFGTIGVMFYLRQVYYGVPEDMMGSAKIDGLSWFGTFIRIALPISAPALLTQFILYFITGYNDYLGPLLYLQSANLTTIQVFLASLQDPYIQNWPQRMAAAVIAMFPLILLYLLSQKIVLKDVSVGSGIKG